MVFVELSDSRIVLRHVSGPRFVLTATLEALEGGRTRLTWAQEFETEREYEAVKDFAPQANEQNFDRLAAELDSRA